MSGRTVAGRVLRAVVAAASALVLLATGYGWASYRTLADGLVTSEALGDRPTAGLDEEFTALLVGIDSRTDAAGDPLPRAVLDRLRAGGDEGQLNTDTIILLHVPAGTGGTASAISVPRDSFVEIAGGLGEHKINTAYRRGTEQAQTPGLSEVAAQRAAREAGRRTLVATVENLTGVSVDHFAEVDLVGFVEITDALGGVPVCLNAAVREPRSGVALPAGRQVLSGADALAFVRQRRGLDGGDLDRVTRQQAFLAGLSRTALAPGTLVDPARLDRLLDAVTRYVVLDRGWDLDRLVTQLRRIVSTSADPNGIAFSTIPTGRLDLPTPVDGVAVEVDPEQVRRYVAEVLDEPDAPAAREGAGDSSSRTETSTPQTTTPQTTTAPTTTAVAQPIAAETVPCVD